MKHRKGIDRFFVRGPLLRCPDCGEETIFQGGSLLGDRAAETDVDPETLGRLYEDCFRAERIESLCSECLFAENQMILWIEVAPREVRGPLCTRCAYVCITTEYGGEAEAVEDARIFGLRNNPSNQDALFELAEFLVKEGEPEEEAKPAYDPEALNLF